MNDKISRREFAGMASAAAASVMLPSEALARSKRRRPGQKVNVAVIGAGGMGASNMAKLTSQNIVALADPDLEHVARSLRDDKGNLKPDRQELKLAYDKADKYADYRRMFDKAKNIDAVRSEERRVGKECRSRWS